MIFALLALAAAVLAHGAITSDRLTDTTAVTTWLGSALVLGVCAVGAALGTPTL